LFINFNFLKSQILQASTVTKFGSAFRTELYAAREKNGVYIPREQYLADEAEKKVLTPFITYDILDCAYSSIA